MKTDLEIKILVNDENLLTATVGPIGFVEYRKLTMIKDVERLGTMCRGLLAERGRGNYAWLAVAASGAATPSSEVKQRIDTFIQENKTLVVASAISVEGKGPLANLGLTLATLCNMTSGALITGDTSKACAHIAAALKIHPVIFESTIAALRASALAEYKMKCLAKAKQQLA